MVKYEMSDQAKKQGFYLESTLGTRIWHTGRPDMTHDDAWQDLEAAGIRPGSIMTRDGTQKFIVTPTKFQQAAEILKFYF